MVEHILRVCKALSSNPNANTRAHTRTQNPLGDDYPKAAEKKEDEPKKKGIEGKKNKLK